MTILPKWFQYLFIALAALGLAYVFAIHLLFRTDVRDFVAISENAISAITLYTSHEVKSSLNRKTWQKIQSAIESSDKISHTGFKGEPWTKFCSIVLETNEYLPYGFMLATRSSMKGMIELRIIRGTPHSMWVYGSYDGTRILEILQEEYPSECAGTAA